jgi:hypothetical protein
MNVLATSAELTTITLHDYGYYHVPARNFHVLRISKHQNDGGRPHRNSLASLISRSANFYKASVHSTGNAKFRRLFGHFGD